MSHGFDWVCKAYGTGGDIFADCDTGVLYLVIGRSVTVLLKADGKPRTIDEIEGAE